MCLLPLFAVAQTGPLTNDVGVVINSNTIPVIADVGKDVATPIIVSMAAKYTWIVTILTVLGIIRFVMKPVMTCVEAVIHATPTDVDDKFLTKCQGSVLYRWFFWVLDWLGSVKPSGTTTTNPILTAKPPIQ